MTTSMIYRKKHTFGSLDSLATQDATQERGKRQQWQEEKMTCLPVTVCATEIALQQQRGDDGEFYMHGLKPGMLALFGLVEGLSGPGGASVDFTQVLDEVMRSCVVAALFHVPAAALCMCSVVIFVL